MGVMGYRLALLVVHWKSPGVPSVSLDFSPEQSTGYNVVELSDRCIYFFRYWIEIRIVF